MEETARNLMLHYGAPGLFVALMLGIVGLPVPDETLLAAAGVLAERGHLPLVGTCAAALLGSCCGITISYVLGRTLGLELVKRYGRFFHLTDVRFARFHNWFARFGRWTLLFGYYIPGISHVSAIAAGASRLSWPSFAVFAYSGAAVWVITFLGGGYWLGRRWEFGSTTAHRVLLAVALALVLVGAGYLALRRLRRRTPPSPE